MLAREPQPNRPAPIASEAGGGPGAPAVAKSDMAVSEPLTTRIRSLIRGVYSRPAYLQWYCQNIGVANLDAESAADDFIKRSTFFDVSPVRLFDPQWFRGRFPVAHVNAFMSYVANDAQRLAPPSPLFWPRWYMRTYGLIRSATHPFLDYLAACEQRSPHPLLDVQYLREQSPSWHSDSTDLEFLQDQTKHRLRPHPLFDSAWYLETNADVAVAGVNPLYHYLYHGHEERRTPNRFFNTGWYRERFLDVLRNAQYARCEPLTHYVTSGSVANCKPGPGLWSLGKASIQRTPHGPKIYVEAVEKNQNLYAKLGHRPQLNMHEISYISPSLESCNQAYSACTLFLRPQRLALMYTPKCASAKIVYWWLEQAGLLDSAMRFDSWSHAFADRFHSSREYVAEALTYDPGKYRTYKFVRHPLHRAASMFTHFLVHTGDFSRWFGPQKLTCSFLEFLHLLRTTDLMQHDVHYSPQVTRAEAGGFVRPSVLKIEDGLDKHFTALEREHGLPPAEFAKNPEIRRILLNHTTQSRASAVVGPADPVRFRSIPFGKNLLTPETIDQIYALYRADFEAYGYEPTP